MRKSIAGLGLVLALSVVQAALAAERQAQLDWLRRVELSTPVSGVVEEVPVRVGDQVRAGQVLVKLDARRVAAQVKQGKAALRRSDEARREAEREWQRAQELYDRTVLSDHELELTRIAFATAEAEHEEAEAGLVQAKLELEYSTVRAPFDGIVVDVRAEPGQTVVSRLEARPLVVLAATGTYLARTALPWREVAAFRVGQGIEVGVDGKRFAGRVTRIGFEVVEHEGREGLFELAVQFETGPDVVYRRGQPAVLYLP